MNVESTTMSKPDLQNLFLKALYKFTEENDITLGKGEHETLWKFAGTLVIIADRKKFSKIYNDRKKTNE